MLIENDKLMNLADGKILYDDLRGRIEEIVSNIATVPETEEIIEIYDKEHAPATIFEFEYDDSIIGFKSIDDANDIVQVYTSGEQIVLFHIWLYDEDQGTMASDVYLQMVGYQAAYGNSDMNIAVAGSLNLGDYLHANSFISYPLITSINNEGKIVISLDIQGEEQQ